MAIRIAASFDSAPVVRSRTFSSGSGSVPAIRRARSTTGRESIPEKRWSSVPIWLRTVSTIAGWLCPRIALIWPDVKSRTRRPSAVVTKLPDALSTISGVNGPP
ncbi:hypothetical protein CCE02nite_38360 [Cellulosimicrobium cellulans]|uniref:Uncharacterized protein n=1 Tax=Cellulosimicrobium cellulans TaxID=1710 RepID=A0A4Y4E4D6_CELCE|nr:hypothetical protein CCE02nite_38360 [Cellulosimicrobium cellulans]